MNNYGKDAFESTELSFGGTPKQTVFSFKNANRIAEAKIVGIPPRQALLKIVTTFGIAQQELTVEAAKVVDKVNEGATMYKVGTLGRSGTIESQFWTLENPIDYINNLREFAVKYGIPSQNLKSGKIFIEAGKLKIGADFITRPAPGKGSNKGGEIEIVTNPNSVMIQTFNTVR